MNTFRARTLLIVLAAMPLAAMANVDCKVKIKDKNGHYREDIKCKGHGPAVVVRQPAVVARPAVVVRQPGVVVRPAVVVRQPAVVARPAVVVRQPAVVVRPAVVVKPPAVVVRPPSVVVRP